MGIASSSSVLAETSSDREDFDTDHVHSLDSTIFDVRTHI